MKNYISILLLLSSIATTVDLSAQGPPITADKPIMLGGGTMILQSLVESRSTTQGHFTAIPIVYHYLPTSNSLIGLHLPFVGYSFDGDFGNSGFGLGDISLLGKYQFYRKDGTGKTFRLVAKTLQTFPTGKELNYEIYSSGMYQSYYGLVAGYESLKHGISNELGYQLSPSGNNDEIRYKLGFGLPLLRPTYPVNQLNLYFEDQSSWFVEQDEYLMLYAQGIQYARGRYTIEAAVQVPLVEDRVFARQRDYSLFFGTRIILN